MAKELGFSQSAPLNLNSLVFLPEVRNMCEANRCQHYNKSWSCPPACGSLEAITEKIKDFTIGIIVQCTGKLSDNFDYDSMVQTGKKQNELFLLLVNMLREKGHQILPMGAGGCNLCPSCSYPTTACRFPDSMMISMEAYGLLVTDVCELSKLPYYYGPKTITYTSCILIK